MIIDLNTNVDVIDGNDERLVIGFFDGLHHGHLSLFDEDTVNTSVLTFKNHPSKKGFLYNLKERLEQLEKLSVKNIYVFDLSQEMTAREFIDRYLKKIEPVEIVVGENFKFGSDQQSYKILEEEFNVTVVPTINNFSTSEIKELIANGDLEKANEMLIWPYYRQGVVIDGLKEARKIHVRTANIKLNEKLVNIKQGVYASKTFLRNKWYKSVSVVAKEQEEGIDRNIETHIMDYEGTDFYSEEMKVILYKRIGDIKKYYFKFSLIKRIKKMIKIASEYTWVKKGKSINE